MDDMNYAALLRLAEEWGQSRADLSYPPDDPRRERAAAEWTLEEYRRLAHP